MTQEHIWLKQFLKKLRLKEAMQVTLICDSQTTLHIASNPVFHEMTKHIVLDCHFVREKVESGDVTTSFVNSNSNDQPPLVFTKSLKGPRISYICI